MPLPLIVRAIITGFGYKIGAEIGRWAATRVGLIDKPQAEREQAQEDLPEGMPAAPPGDEPAGEAPDNPEGEAQSA
jgi:hypothetical protein